MSEKKWLAVFVTSLALYSCGGLQVTPCVSDPMKGLQCAPPKAEVYLLPYEESENYVCLSQPDTEKLIEFMKKKCKQ